MFNRQIIFAAFIFVLYVFTGCATLISGKSSQTPPVLVKKVAPGTEIKPSSSRYFNYLKARSHAQNKAFEQAITAILKAISEDPASFFLKRDLVEMYLEKDEPEKALAVVEALLVDQPDNADAHVLLGSVHAMKKNYQKAAESYETALTLDPKKERIYYLLGKYYLEENNFENAVKVYESLTQNFPDTYLGYYYLGKIYREMDDFEKAESALKRSMELAPDPEAPREELEALYKSSGNQKKLIELYQNLHAREPGDIHAAAELALIFHREGKIQKRDIVLKRFLEHAWKNEDLVDYISRRFVQNGQLRDAVILTDAILKRRPQSNRLNYFNGLLYEQLGKPDKAMSYYKNVTPQSGFFQNAVAQVVTIYEDTGRDQRSIAYIKEQIAKRGDLPGLWYLYGNKLEDQEDNLKGAVDAYQQGLLVEPDNVPLHYRLGVVFDKAGQKNACIRQMKKVIDLDPENANALNYLGYTYAELGIYLDEAEAMIVKALNTKPEDGYITDSLGWVYFKKGAYPKALEYLERAAELIPDDPTIRDHLGDTYLKMGESEKALKNYRRSLEQQTDDDMKIELREKIRSLEDNNSNKI